MRSINAHQYVLILYASGRHEGCSLIPGDCQTRHMDILTVYNSLASPLSAEGSSVVAKEVEEGLIICLEL